ncbi:GNAT family N-acetyltransferase [Tsukamurella paurometabola]|uniref:Enhanced intracellular survival protein n=1 Tax=Tsukamurella paurometabola TaxID=2061 RepID=A0A3P8MBZ7_TSUPA|nr:GNAT family N-acetyltransferase [Tsukamurella paurometabola]UEA82893.1 GNAT family N-acetyltransferase [Tsukamurella paurometabola]VDR39970.1 Enhanced intracellular survival protein [Tsukamurella paurometabola]
MTDSSAIDFQRVTTREQLLGFQQCASIGFQSRLPDADQWVEAVSSQLDSLDHRIAVDGARTVGTFLSFDQELTAVGGARVPVRAVSAVTVLPTHRRRGILGTHMRECLGTALAGGAAAATLIAAEHAIYGRYGFGQSTESVDLRIAVDRGRLPQPPVGEVRYAGGEEYLEASTRIRELLDFPGRVSKLDINLRRTAGVLAGGGPDETLRVVLRRDGEVAGVLAYTVAPKWTDSRPDSTLKVTELLGVDAAAERDLWSFAMSIDWVLWVEATQRPLDDIATTVPVDPRTVQLSNRTDFLWIRPFDVPALFSARTYAAPGRLVLEVTDPGFDGAGPGPAHGRFLISTDGGAGTCTPTDEPADLALDVTDLGRLWLSDEPVARRVAVGSIRELSDGAAARADLMLFSPRRAWAVEMF